MKVALILPCFNEGNNLQKIRKDFLSSLNILKNIKVELVIVNNGSTDSSKKILSEKKYSDPKIIIVNVSKNIGYGHGIKEGIKSIDADIYSWAHGDLQTPMIDILSSISVAVESKVLVLAGQRDTKGKQKIQSRIFDFVISTILGFWAYDINAQPKIFHKKFKNHFLGLNSPDDFALDMFFFKVFNFKKIKIFRNLVKFEDRTEGIAKGGQGNILSRVALLKKMCSFAIKLRNMKFADH